MVRFVRCLALAACLGLPLWAHAQEPERLRIHGSNSIGERLMPALVEDWLRAIGYEKLQRMSPSGTLTEVHAVRDGQPLVVQIDRHGSASGLQALIHGDTELAMSTRVPNAAEREAGWQLGDLSSADQQFVLALNGARVLVAQGNPLHKLDIDQLRALLAGRIDNWKQLGGADRPLRLICTEGGAGLADYLRQRVGPLERRACSRSLRSLRETAAAVATDPDAIAMVELATPAAAGTRALAISDGGIAVAPDTLGVRSEDYPLVQRYSVYGGQMMSALGRSFALYLLGPSAQQVVARQGLPAMTLPDNTGKTPAPEGGKDAYDQAVAGAVRLPLNVRFNLRSLGTMFEGGSVQDLDRLVAWMQQPQNRHRPLAVVGFANPDPANRLFPTIASNDRADIVASYLAERGIVVQRARGLGAVRPLAGAADPGARQRNERVEIWML
jgi:phosphate transport system substrate-binding protein